MHPAITLHQKKQPVYYFYNMHSIKNIIFDMGGVLLNLDFKSTQDAFRNLGMNNIDELFRHGHTASFFKEYEKGTLSDEEFIREAKAFLKQDVSDGQVIDAWNAMLLDFPADRISFVEQLKQGYRIFLLSNTNAIHYRCFQATYRDAYGGKSFNDLFERAYYSHLIKFHKPDTRAYQLVLDENRLLPEETMFIDDSFANVEAAEQVGIRGYFLKPGESVVEAGNVI
jgi:putative hydrolase of the HAD superfamily